MRRLEPTTSRSYGRWLRAAAIGVGGAIGTLARYGIERGIPTAGFAMPWSTLAVNVAGSLLLGVVLTLVVERWSPTTYVRPFAAIGVCGGFTTFSTLAVEVAQRGQHGRAVLAAVYLVVSVVAGMAAAALGIAAARGRIRLLPADRVIPDPDDLGLLHDWPSVTAEGVDRGHDGEVEPR